MITIVYTKTTLQVKENGEWVDVKGPRRLLEIAETGEVEWAVESAQARDPDNEYRCLTEMFSSAGNIATLSLLCYPEDGEAVIELEDKIGPLFEELRTHLDDLEGVVYFEHREM